MTSMLRLIDGKSLSGVELTSGFRSFGGGESTAYIACDDLFYYAPYPAKGRALPKAMNGRGWVGCICIFFAFVLIIVL